MKEGARYRRKIGGLTHTLSREFGNLRGSRMAAAFYADERRTKGRSVKVVRDRKSWAVYVRNLKPGERLR